MVRADIVAPDMKHLMHPMLAKEMSPPKRKMTKEHPKVSKIINGSPEAQELIAFLLHSSTRS